MNTRYWTLAKRPPPPWPDDATFALKETPIPAPGPGQALTRTIYVSLDPYQWGLKRRGEEPEGLPCHARTVSQVLESRIDGIAPGDFVFHNQIQFKVMHSCANRTRAIALRRPGAERTSQGGQECPRSCRHISPACSSANIRGWQKSRPSLNGKVITNMRMALGI